MPSASRAGGRRASADFLLVPVRLGSGRIVGCVAPTFSSAWQERSSPSLVLRGQWYMHDCRAAYLGGRSGGRAVQRQEDEQRTRELRQAEIEEAKAFVLESQDDVQRRQKQIEFLAEQIENAEAAEREMIQKARDFISH